MTRGGEWARAVSSAARGGNTPPPHQHPSSKTHALTRGNTAYSTVTLTFTLRSEAEYCYTSLATSSMFVKLRRWRSQQGCQTYHTMPHCSLLGHCIISLMQGVSKWLSNILRAWFSTSQHTPRRRMQLCPEMIGFVREPPFCVFTKQCLSQDRFGQLRLNLAWLLNATQGHLQTQ